MTQKKLAEEQQNLVRVTDILSELTRQLGPLERQSETAKVYLKKKEELKLLDVNMFLMELDRIREDLGKNRSALSDRPAGNWRRRRKRLSRPARNMTVWKRNWKRWIRPFIKPRSWQDRTLCRSSRWKDSWNC